ncbi:hypothetical protein [Noviherbaspirillum sp. Root189]|uniref:hypothetical protein n=1 Tax=Noviherbaspirillum sp. Root189 TaxID=1736487 RepID=UPI00070DF41C|nr:hypothetical protein [Noviherbaspirillum sp. Root189]KRB73482.1 hypothetical protein ASE07_06415 [Noviherbaspirillum sp. Root189]
MKERPILFSAPMVRAILDGSKTQTRRVVKLPPAPDHLGQWEATSVGGGGVYDQHGRKIPYQGAIWHTRTGKVICSPHGQPGDRLWVRETFCPIYPQDPAYNGGQPIEYDYAATYQHGDRLGDHLGVKKVWKPSIHMPRTASRILLEVTGVRVERLQDISEADAIAEGIEGSLGVYRDYHQDDGIFAYGQDSYRSLWELINGPGSWEANPWAWVVEFKRINMTHEH